MTGSQERNEGMIPIPWDPATLIPFISHQSLAFRGCVLLRRTRLFDGHPRGSSVDRRRSPVMSLSTVLGGLHPEGSRKRAEGRRSHRSQKDSFFQADMAEMGLERV